MGRNRPGTQPILLPTGGPQGQRQALQAAQQAVPLPAGPVGMAGGAQAPPPPDMPRPDIFGPTARPDEPLTAGAALGAGPPNPGMLPEDPAELLRLLNTLYPSPGTKRMMERFNNASA